MALCAALALAAPSIWALPNHYHLTDLGPESQAEAISPGGRIAGQDARHGRFEAAVWIHAKAHDRSNPFSRADAHGVNDAGVAVGEVGGLNFRHAAVWHGDQLTDFGAMLGARISAVTAINSMGDCVIDAETRSELNSFIVPGCADTRVLVKIPSLGGTGTITAAINDSGEVAGTAAPANSPVRAFLYSQGITHDLGLLDGDTESAAKGINDLGHVVGASALYPFLFRGFFHDGQAMHALGTFGGAHAGANAINHDDIVVGTADTDQAGQFFHAFVVDAARDPATLHDLGTMLDKSGNGWSLEEAVAINDAGQIIVHGFAPGDPNPRSALLTPMD
jgi:probable HAF family extracellular repeat protein